MHQDLTFMGNQFDEIAEIIDNARTRAMRAVCTMASVRQHLNGGKNTTDYYILCQIAELVNEGVCADGGRIRGIPVTIGGTGYVSPLPLKSSQRKFYLFLCALLLSMPPARIMKLH